MFTQDSRRIVHHQAYFAHPYIMHPYSYSQDQTDDQDQDRQRSLSSATHFSQNPTHRSATQSAATYSPQQTYYPSQYAAMQPAQSAAAQGQYYAQPARPAHAYANVTPPGQTLRDLPFSNARPMAAAGGQGTGMYAGAQPTPRPIYRAPSHASLAQSTQYGSPPAPPPGVQYIPTPAQTITMQSYHGASSSARGGGPSAIVIPAASASPGVERHPCDMCDRTFSRPHDRKRHKESQHEQISHICPGCIKDFSRSDSLKRHLDNGCDRMPH